MLGLLLYPPDKACVSVQVIHIGSSLSRYWQPRGEFSGISDSPLPSGLHIARPAACRRRKARSASATASPVRLATPVAVIKLTPPAGA
jgi:hypothetical protein